MVCLLVLVLYTGNRLMMKRVPNSAFDLGLEQNLGLDTSGNFGFDTVTLGWQGAGGPTIEHATVATIANFTYWLGIFGVNPRSTNFTTLNDPQPSYMTQLYNQSKIPSLSYGYTAGSQYRFDGVFGSLTLGGYDTSKFEPTNVTFPFGGDISRDLLVGVQSITSTNSKTALSQASGSFYAYIDSTIPYMYLPMEVCLAFEEAFGLTWNSTLELYLVNQTLHTQLKEQDASVTFLLAPNSTSPTVNITLPYSAFDLNVSYPIVETSTYYFPLKQAKDETQYTLGRAFLQEAYLITDYQRQNFTVAPCVWSQTATSNIKPILAPGTDISSSKSSKSFPAGAIAGVVIGIVAIIAILGLILWFLRRKKQHRRNAATKAAELEATEKAQREAESTDGPEGKPFISKPYGGELSSESGIHEMHAPFKSSAAEMDSPQITDPNKVGYNEMEGEGDVEYFGKMGRLGTHEMQGDTPIYEMPGSEVHELSDRTSKG